jgi:hypothetical protein
MFINSVTVLLNCGFLTIQAYRGCESNNVILFYYLLFSSLTCSSSSLTQSFSLSPFAPAFHFYHSVPFTLLIILFHPLLYIISLLLLYILILLKCLYLHDGGNKSCDFNPFIMKHDT